MTENLILDLILPCLTQIWAPKIFLQVFPVLVVRNCLNLTSYVIYRKSNQPHLRKWQKKNKLILGLVLVPNLVPNFLWVLPLLDIITSSRGKTNKKNV